MANNTITLTIGLCGVAPANGYIVSYRPVGDTGEYRSAGPFFASPFVFVDTLDAMDTQYEGYVQSDCGGGKLGVQVPWQTAADAGSESGGGSESGSIEPPTGSLQVAVNSEQAEIVNITGGWYNITSGSFPVGNLETMEGTVEAFSGDFGVGITKFIGPSCFIRLYIDAVQFNCLEVSGSGSYLFEGVTFTPDSDVEILINETPC